MDLILGNQVFFNRSPVLLSSGVLWDVWFFHLMVRNGPHFIELRGYKRQFLVCLVITIAGWLSLVARGQGKPSSVPPSRSTLSQGSQLFSAYCASCHGLDGHGGHRAPDIIGEREVQKLSNARIEKIVREGIAGTGMPSFRVLGDAKIQALVRHIRTLQGQGSNSPLPGSPESGRILFFGKAGCAECHMVNGTGGFIGSDLSAYGRSKSVAEIREAITKPNPYLDERGRVVVATTQDGQTFTGIPRNEDNFSLQMQTKDGAFHFFEKSSLRGIEHSPESLMPSDYVSRLTRQEIDDIVSYVAAVASRGQSGSQRKDRNPMNGSGGPGSEHAPEQ
jgi:cytochrome c oxidase cbb3-type subunit III